MSKSCYADRGLAAPGCNTFLSKARSMLSRVYWKVAAIVALIRRALHNVARSSLAKLAYIVARIGNNMSALRDHRQVWCQCHMCPCSLHRMLAPSARDDSRTARRGGTVRQRGLRSCIYLTFATQPANSRCMPLHTCRSLSTVMQCTHDKNLYNSSAITRSHGI